MNSPFEAIMMICFGASWPFAILKTIRAKNPAGKSFLFLGLVVIGYLAGCIHKIYYNFDRVFWLYALNSILVSVDMALSFYYLKKLKRHF
ncbi:MAG: hypothetical protein PHQ27_05640 [Victivallales bacterium]|nr:hypothetical protein [Victivallales bacterium]